MDVNAEIATRTTAVLALMQEWLAGRPALPAGATAWERALAAAAPPAAAPGPAEAAPVPRHLLRRAAELLAPATNDDAPPEAGPATWPDFLVLARRLVRHLETVPAQEANLRPPPAAPGRALAAGPAAELAALLDEVPALLRAGRPLPPAAWRRALRRLLYRAVGQRLALCAVLSPRPDDGDLFEPLLIQTLLRAPGADRIVREATALDPVHHRQQAVSRLLLAPELLAACLDTAELAVPFAHVLGRELEEVAHRRSRLAGAPAGPAAPGFGPDPSPDPLLRPFGPGQGPFVLAEGAQLLGLALSGGGIRSATFGLGAVQALARHGWLPRLDYLSTVSGGGYLGSWLVALIQRLGSVEAAQQQLDPTQTPNPRAEENRPVRWLRSFSNYLAPQASAFSTDAWTLVTTWLRNALLNQAILGLFLSAALLAPHFLLARWTWWGRQPPGYALGAAAVLLALTAGLAGWQQRWYDRPAGEGPPRAPRWVPAVLPWLLLAAGWHLAAYAAYAPAGPAPGGAWFAWVSGVLSGWLLVVAALGRYHLCFGWARPRPWWAWAVIALTSALAAGGAAALLWLLARQLPALVGQAPHPSRLVNAAVMVLVPALGVEVLGLALAGRMALLGRAFTDERREWWGRMGAQAHLAVLGWVLLGGTSLLLPHGLDHLSATVRGYLPATTAAWVALVGAGVRLAHGSGAPAQAGTGPRSAPARLTDALTRAVPYLFLAGLLAGLVWALQTVLPAVGDWGRAHGWATLWVPARAARPAQYFPDWQLLLALIAGLGGLSWLLAWRVGVNEFSLHHFYKNRLLRAYLGASRPRDERRANPFTDFDTADDLRLCQLRHRPLPAADGTRPPAYHGPLPLLNTALNVTRGGELAHQDRQAESFAFSPLYAGFDFARLVPVQRPDGRHAEYAYRPTHAYAYPAPAAAPAAGAAPPPPAAGGVHIGTVMAISGAAANPNMGYHSSPVTAFLLTLFNVRLGWWMGNPRNATWQSANPRTGLGYLLKDLFGRAAPTDDYVCLSDGGHFDNLGLYELVRRRCRYVIVCDGEEDGDRRFEGLATAIRHCRVDFGVEIDIDLSALRTRDACGHTAAHAALGTITYPDQPTPGTGAAVPRAQLLYLKATLTGHEPADVLEYAHQNPTFPHQSTSDQFFSENQFESYRQLGYFAAARLFEVPAGSHPPAAGPLPDPAPLFEAGRLSRLYPIR